MARNGWSEETLEGQGYVFQSFFYVTTKGSVGKLCSLDIFRIEGEACEHEILKIKAKQLPPVFLQLVVYRKDVIFCFSAVRFSHFRPVCCVSFLILCIEIGIGLASLSFICWSL